MRDPRTRLLKTIKVRAKIPRPMDCRWRKKKFKISQRDYPKKCTPASTVDGETTQMPVSDNLWRSITRVVDDRHGAGRGLEIECIFQA